MKIQYLTGFLKNSVLFLLFCFFVPLMFSDIYAQGFLRADGQKIVNDKGEILLRGMGLGGWMLQEPYMMNLSGVSKNQTDIKNRITELIGKEKTEEFYEAWLANGVKKSDIDLLAGWGFNSIRLPIHYDLYTLPINKEPKKGENTWINKGFVMTDSLLSWCKQNQIYLILDLHAAPGGQGNDLAISDAADVKLWNSVANKEKTVALWKKLAERYKDEEWIGGYDILNEPNWGFQDSEDLNGCKEELNAPVRQLYIDITKAIREVDKKHIIIISGNCWGNNYKGIFPLWDDNIAISFHKYWNYNKQSEIEGFLRFRKENNAPLWMSESGENSNAWHNDAIRLFEENNIGWCWWNYKKMPNACPMQIPSNPQYEQIIKYWKGEGDRPSADLAYKGLMQLAEDYKLNNTFFKKDYVDALFRQVQTTETIPYKENTVRNNQTLTIYASDYDLGRSGYAYHDNDSANYRTSTGEYVMWNKGNVYRNDGVDITKDASAENGYSVFSIDDNEWLQYTFNVEKSGIYNISLYTKSEDGVGEVLLDVNGKKSETLNTSNEKSEWNSVTFEKVNLKKGKNVLRTYFNKGGFNFSKIEIKK